MVNKNIMLSIEWLLGIQYYLQHQKCVRSHFLLVASTVNLKLQKY